MYSSVVRVRTGSRPSVRDITGEAAAHGSPGHGRDHLLPAFVAPYAVLPVVDGTIALGTWQSICLVDVNGDNPERQVRFSFMPG